MSAARVPLILATAGCASALGGRVLASTYDDDARRGESADVRAGLYEWDAATGRMAQVGADSAAWSYDAMLVDARAGVAFTFLNSEISTFDLHTRTFHHTHTFVDVLRRCRRPRARTRIPAGL